MLVRRPRLIDLMDKSLRRPVTVVSGEPASGKTSMTIDWLRSANAAGRPIAWLTLRRGLDDPVLFWQYLVSAIESLGVATEDLGRSLADDEPPDDTWLTVLANRLAAVPGEPVIVLDDFHELTSAEALVKVQTLLERVPGPPRFLILTRTKPPWPSPRWQVSGRLAEIDSLDLRFTAAETRSAVKAAGLELADEDLTRLVEATEGWAGGITLALLSMRHADPSDFLARFPTDDELISGYLVREVLGQLSAELRAFLLDSSILDDLTPEVCDALRERTDSRELLRQSYDNNLFLTRLPGPAEEFHIHGLFAQFLMATLSIEDPDRRALLHHRASRLFEERGDIRSALVHAAETQDHARVSALIMQHGFQLAHQGEFDQIRSWIPLLRQARSPDRPEISLALAQAHTLCGQTSQSLELLDEIEELNTSSYIQYVATQQRAHVLMQRGRLDAFEEIAAALASPPCPASNAIGEFTFALRPRALHSALVGLAAFFAGDLAAASAALGAASQESSSPLFYVESLGWMARVACAEGNLQQAERYAQESLDRHVAWGGDDTAIVVPACLALADIAWERNQLEEAEQLLARARRSTRPVWWEMIPVQVSASRTLASRSELDKARLQLIECGRTYLSGESSPLLRSFLCEGLIDVALRADDIDEARQWVRTRATSSERPLSLALRLRLSAAEGTVNEVPNIERTAAEQPRPQTIEILLGAATMAKRRGDHRRCLDLVAKATAYAEHEGMLRRFLDASEEVRASIQSLVTSPLAGTAESVASPFFLANLSSALHAQPGERIPLTGRSDELVEQLTPRELEVLNLLATTPNYRDIGSRLYVSRNTVKSHVRHVYTKLAVASRDEAITEARRLGLL